MPSPARSPAAMRVCRPATDRLAMPSRTPSTRGVRKFSRTYVVDDYYWKRDFGHMNAVVSSSRKTMSICAFHSLSPPATTVQKGHASGTGSCANAARIPAPRRRSCDIPARWLRRVSAAFRNPGPGETFETDGWRADSRLRPCPNEGIAGQIGLPNGASAAQIRSFDVSSWTSSSGFGTRCSTEPRSSRERGCST